MCVKKTPDVSCNLVPEIEFILFPYSCDFVAGVIKFAVCALLTVQYMPNRNRKKTYFLNIDMKNMVISQVIYYYQGRILQKNEIPNLEK